MKTTLRIHYVGDEIIIERIRRQSRNLPSFNGWETTQVFVETEQVQIYQYLDSLSDEIIEVYCG